MCGISGFVRISKNGADNGWFKAYFDRVNSHILARGPDCFGIITGNGIDKVIQKTDKVDMDTVRVLTTYAQVNDATYGLVNFRGIPTTESRGKGLQTIQPYLDNESDPKFAVVHNGQLSNDETLLADRPNIMTTGRDIDSYLFLKMMQNIEREYTNLELGPRAWWSKQWAEALTPVEGSYAVAVLGFNKIFFGRNFLGLTFAIWERGEAMYLVWSSEAESLLDLKGPERVHTWEMPLGSSLVFDLEADPHMYGNHPFEPIAPHNIFKLIAHDVVPIEHRSLVNVRSVAVVLSGGMDSTVCAALACQSYSKVHLLHFRYGARAEAREVESVKKITESLRNTYTAKGVQVFLQFIDLNFIKELGGSTLTESDGQIAQGELGMETTHEWVPARNLAMIGLAASYCDRYDIGAIMLGLNREEGGVFCDNSSEFYKALEPALALGTKSKPKMVMPLGNAMKHHIVAMGVDARAPMQHSWSCYLGGEERCGTCGPCTLRQRAFAMNGLTDSVYYVTRDPVSVSMLSNGDNQ